MSTADKPDAKAPLSHVAREAAEREARLAEALRANLRRRKEQARDRDDADDAQ
ncbi:hypothetical protein [Gimibacter soli]|uniref:Uncharacterized protein n=1 Tax=Gimibacter soli TaxID=3024400 RepID=A0AAE9XTG5_9PROT|nr:hypothetical protein [Gimibacter soli]WCL54865.1 hypothetical protein PH603_03715 [Gimibacter soli]